MTPGSAKFTARVKDLKPFLSWAPHTRDPQGAGAGVCHAKGRVGEQPRTYASGRALMPHPRGGRYHMCDVPGSLKTVAILTFPTSTCPQDNRHRIKLEDLGEPNSNQPGRLVQRPCGDLFAHHGAEHHGRNV